MECPHCAPPSCPSPRPLASPTEGRGLPPWPILAADSALGFPSPLWRPSPAPLGCLPTPGGCLWDTQVPEKRGQWGQGWGSCFRPQGLPRESRAAQEGARRQGHHRAGSPSRAHGAAGLPSAKNGGGAGQAGVQTGPPQWVPLAKVRMAPVGVPMRWPRSGEPPALSPQVPVVSGACRGRSPRPACFPSLQSRPCRTCCCLRPGSAASPGRGWALPPLARHLEAPPEAARLSGPREPAPGPWGRLPRGREAPPGTRKGGFLCSIPCKSGLGWALPGRTSCVCCLLITGSVSEQTGGRGRAGGCGGAGAG